MSRHHRRGQQGFTLVELLIVVIILGILAAVVIPQFNNAASESKEAAMSSNLATVRQAIEMYKVQHNDAFPTDLDGPAGNNGQLTARTDIDGIVSATGAYGPYLRNSFPKNPISVSGINPAAIDETWASGTGADDTTGWVYDDVTGEFRANSTGTGPSGIAYHLL